MSALQSESQGQTTLPSTAPANGVSDDTSAQSQPAVAPIVELPGYFEDVQLDDLVVLIADLLQRMVNHNDQIPLSAEGLTRFHSRSTPAISILEYLRRIVRYVRVERSVLLIMLHSIDQICARRPSFNISSLSVHRFIIASITILSKTFCDAFSPNPLFAKVGGVSLIELNLLEREFLSAMDWRLACTREVLHAYYVKLARTHSSGQYSVPDTSPRPAHIDTLPSDQIEWNHANGSSESLGSTRRRRHGQNSSEMMNVEDNIAMEDGNSSDSSSDGEDGESPAMATDILPSRRLQSRGLSRTASPAMIGQNLRRTPIQPSSNATVEQNVAFMEMRSQAASRSTLAPPPSTGATAAVDPGISKSPLSAFRSPVVGRRRRRSTGKDEDPRVASGFLSMDPNTTRLLGHTVDVSDPAAMEGLLRGSRRRRLHMDGNNRDRRMEVEPGTPV